MAFYVLWVCNCISVFPSRLAALPFTFSVPCSPLHALMRRHGIESADLLSLDVEGAEALVFESLDKPAGEYFGAMVVEADGRVAIHCAEWDAISDVKRALEAQFSEAWDLVGRPRDRDGCFAGWELVSGETPLGPHFFVGDYGLRRGDVVHAVVRRRG